MCVLWYTVFHDVLDRSVRDWAGELRGIRNRWAHGEEFNVKDTYRALDTMERLLDAVSATEAARRVGEMREELILELYGRYCEERGIEVPVDEQTIARVCEGAPEVSQRLRTMVLAAQAGASLLRPLKDPAISNLHETSPHVKREIVLKRPCGQGGYGCVYEATQLSTERTVAVKLFSPGTFQEESFDREWKILKLLGNAKNIPDLYDAGRHEGYWYFVSEWVSGCSLGKLIQERYGKARSEDSGHNTGKGFASREIREILLGILNALCEAHKEWDKFLTNGNGITSSPEALRRDHGERSDSVSRGAHSVTSAQSPQASDETGQSRSGDSDEAKRRELVHGDIKPANVLITGDVNGIKADNVWLVDFGVAQASGRLLGFTQEYASPEMLVATACGTVPTLTAASDVFQVGLIGFELATGKKYWEIANEGTLDDELAKADLPENLCACILRALEWDPRKRFRGPSEFLEELNRRPPTPLGRVWRSTRALRVVVVASFAVALGGVFVGWRGHMLSAEMVSLRNRNSELTQDNRRLRDELARRTAPLDAIQRYRSLRDRFNRIHNDPLETVAASAWRTAMAEDLEAYLKQFPVDARYPKEIKRAVNWLRRLEQPTIVGIKPVALEEFAWLRSAMVGFRIYRNNTEVRYWMPVEVNGRAELSEEKPILVPWKPGDEIEVQLLDDSDPVEREFLHKDLLKRLMAGTLGEDVPLDISNGNRKASFRINVKNPPDKPPRLP